MFKILSSLAVLSSATLVAQEVPEPLVLSLPGGQSMRFVPVLITEGENLFAQRTFNIGSPAYVNEPVTSVSISGTVCDGEKWYIPYCETEVTNAQYAAVMGTAAPMKGLGDMPKVNVSYSETCAFLARLNGLMRKDAAFNKSLARYNNEKTAEFYLRLPTAVEWEFAARGGSVVTPSSFDANHPYPSNKISNYEVLFDGRARSPKPRPVKGRREANPVGLYDMIGNVSEMVSPMHYFNCRLGRAGGIPVCGGNFLTEKQNARASDRVECAPYDAKGKEFRSDRIGFRPVIGSVIRHNKMSLENFEQQWTAFKENELPPRDAATQGRNQQLADLVEKNKKELEAAQTRISELQKAADKSNELQTQLKGESAVNSELMKELAVLSSANDALRKELESLRKQMVSIEEQAVSVKALAAENQRQRAEAGVSMLMTVGSELSYFLSRLEARKSLDPEYMDAEMVAELQKAIQRLERNITSAEIYLHKACTLLFDTDEAIVQDTLNKCLDSLKTENPALYACLVPTAEFYLTFRKTAKYPPVEPLKTKLLQAAEL